MVTWQVASHALGLWLGMLAMDIGRYALVAGVAYLVFWKWGRARFSHKLVQQAFPRAAKLVHDARWSMCTALIFSLFGVGVWYGGRAGLLRMYFDVHERGWLWFAFSVVALIVLQDTYFYWAHRAMHHPWLYRRFHRVHHMSTNPSPWTAYAFAPGEAIVHAAFVPLVWLWLPMHEAAVFVFLLFMTVRNVHGHLSMELYPSGFTRHRFWGWHTTVTHHNLHHKHFTTNFGLYSTFWDRVMGTTDARYDATFERVAGRDRRARSGRPWTGAPERASIPG